MSTPILDDPQGLDNQYDAKNTTRYWLIAGMGMAILLLANNLKDIYNPWPVYLYDWGEIRLETNRLVFFVVFTAGMIWLMEALLRLKPVPSKPVAALNAVYSSLLAVFAHHSIQIFASLDLTDLLAFQLFSIFLTVLYCVVIALIWFGFRQKKGCLPGVILLMLLIALSKFGFDNLLQML